MTNYKEKFEVLSELPKLLSSGFVFQTDTSLKGVHLNTFLFMQRYPEQHMAFYAGKIGQEKGSFTYVVDKLEKKGYIQRVPFKKDRRKLSLAFTEKGQITIQKLDQEFEKHLARVVSVLDENELNTLLNTMDQLASIRDKIKAHVDR